MSVEDVKAEIIGPMRALFTMPRILADTEERIALKQYEDALHRFPGEVLRKAWVRVRDGNLARSWPSVGVVVRACIDIQRSEEQPETPQHSRRCWEGGPTCDRCKEKRHSNGFFVAASEQHREVEAVRAELDAWTDSRIPASRLDEAEMHKRFLLTQELVRDHGWDWESARRKVMFERTKALYPEFKIWPAIGA